jgi:hypothetical protein
MPTLVEGMRICDAKEATGQRRFVRRFRDVEGSVPVSAPEIPGKGAGRKDSLV